MLQILINKITNILLNQINSILNNGYEFGKSENIKNTYLLKKIRKGT